MDRADKSMEDSRSSVVFDYRVQSSMQFPVGFHYASRAVQLDNGAHTISGSNDTAETRYKDTMRIF